MILKLIKKPKLVDVPEIVRQTNRVAEFLTKQCGLTSEKIRGVMYSDFRNINEAVGADNCYACAMAAFTGKTVSEFEPAAEIQIGGRTPLPLAEVLEVYKSVVPEMSFKHFIDEASYNFHLRSRAKKNYVNMFPIVFEITKKEIDYLMQTTNNVLTANSHAVLGKVWLDENDVLQTVYVDYQQPNSSPTRFSGNLYGGKIAAIKDWYAFIPTQPQMLATKSAISLQALGFMFIEKNRAILAEHNFNVRR